MKVRNFLPIFLLLAVATGLPVLTTVLAAAEPSLVIQADRIITATGAKPIVNGAVVISGNRIIFVGPRSKMPQAKTAKVLRPRNASVLPGLFDSHVHYREWMPLLFLYYGVTTVLDTGNKTDWILAQREALRKGEMVGPRLFTTGLAIDGVPLGDRARENTVVTSAAEARKAAQKLLRRGVDAIKVHEWLPPDLVRVVAEEAGPLHKPVLGHLGSPVDALIRAGLNCLIHPYGIELATNPDPRVRSYIQSHMADYQGRKEYYPYHELSPEGYPALIKLMIERGVFFNPTFGAQFRGIYPQGPEFEAYDRKVFEEKIRGLPYLSPSLLADFLPFFTLLRSHPVDDAQRKTLLAGMEKVALFMREFVAAGGKMLAGTDTSRTGIPGLRLHRELELWVDNGIPAMEALRAATQYPIELLHQDADLGTVETGKLADLVVVEGNPVEDIRATQNILYVIKDGRVLSRDLVPAAEKRPQGTRRGEGPLPAETPKSLGLRLSARAVRPREEIR